MNTKVLSISLAVSAVALPSIASANEIYVYGSVGSTDSTHTIERNLGANPPVLPVQDASGVTQVSDNGVSFQLGAGYQFDIPDSPLFVAAEGYYSFEDTNSRNINGVLVTDLALDARYGGRVLTGVNVTDDFAFYSHGGVAWVDYDLNNSYTFAPPVRDRSDTESAFSYGVGARYRLTDNLSAFVDYTRVSDIEFGGIAEVAGGTGRVNPNTLRVETLASGLRFAF